MKNLIEINDHNAVTLYQGEGINNIIADIEEAIANHVPDVHTTAGRKEVASLAYKIAQTKTKLDTLGKGLTDDWRKQTNAVNAKRKATRDRLDDLRDEARKPLTEWEADQERIAEEKRITAEVERDHTQALKDNRLFELEQQEIERKRTAAKQEAKRQQEIRENAIRKEVEARAKKQAEEEAQAKIKAAQDKERKAKAAAQQANIEKKEAKERAERQKKEAAERATREKAEAEKQKQQAIENARIETEQRIAEETRKKEAQEAKIKAEADKKAKLKSHVNTIKKEAFVELSKHIGKEHAATALRLINENAIPHVRINYL